VIRLEKLIIRKLRNVAPSTELHFHHRGALLLGKNGTGKTTLLDVIVKALSSNWQQLAATSKRSSKATSMQYGPMSLRCTTQGSRLRGDQLSFPSADRL
jgi:predicted ATP-binding protein involved in virulence